MLKHIVSIAVAGFLALSVSSAASSTTGSWQVDSHQSSAQIITDGTTDFGKTKINFTVGFARISGTITLDDAAPANAKLDFCTYPASSKSPFMADGSFDRDWFANAANHTLVCFHSKNVVATADGKLQATGDLVLTRVDRNVQLDPTEAYSGPVFGPATINRVSHEVTFAFEPPAGGATGQKDAAVEMTGSTNLARQDFPQLVKAEINTSWPTLVQDEQCQNPAGGNEDYSGFQCTGKVISAPGLPPPPVQIGEDYPAASDFSAVVGNQLTIKLRLQLKPTAAPVRPLVANQD
jgi:polyisoprenoid-binding protein YceI